jgi:hypothetical protein
LPHICRQQTRKPLIVLLKRRNRGMREHHHGPCAGQRGGTRVCALMR